MDNGNELPKGVWRWLGRSVVFILIASIAGIGLISAGVFDPKPVGNLKSSIPLDELIVPAGAQRLVWMETLLPEGDKSVRLVAQLLSGEYDAGYGVVVGGKSENVTVALSPLGYVAVWQNTAVSGANTAFPRSQLALDRLAGSGSPVLPWQKWPHVQMGGESNELWLDIHRGQLSAIRINRELLMESGPRVRGRQVGLWLESFGEQATVEFQKLELFAGDSPPAE